METSSIHMSRVCGMPLDETPLFEPSLLSELDWSSNSVSFFPPISPSSPGQGLVLRPLCTADFNRGFYKVLSQLTLAGDVTPEQFIRNFEHMKKTGDYYVVVVEDTNIGQIVATATLITEHKFIHSCAKRGRVEEVVVSDVCRGKQLGKLFDPYSSQQEAGLLQNHTGMCSQQCGFLPEVWLLCLR
ncbi:glucosamine 6-phosphate N-acetyltransferase isoform X2 [Lampris incognitus]|uniref:glucosamine 6-phosphate N-acetyltransferase isoform X2 n=1 Tax=Lampris incognitus TaxID=2546036 RepID=UPI0024B5AB2B|nr:glucosamine 6-phosphate N-acetyltransferase isoform X2 [Lampris incognitus]